MDIQNTIVIHHGKVQEFSSLGKLLDWVVDQITNTLAASGIESLNIPQPAKVEVKAEVRPEPEKTTITSPNKDKRATETLNKILAKDQLKVTEEKRPSPIPNQFDLPPMRPFFGGSKGGAPLFSYLYFINGDLPRHKPSDVARHIFVNTEAYRDMPQKAKDIVLRNSLSFLKKECRETGKPASCETKMLRAFSHDRFSFLAGAKVTFKVSIDPKSIPKVKA